MKISDIKVWDILELHKYFSNPNRNLIESIVCLITHIDNIRKSGWDIYNNFNFIKIKTKNMVLCEPYKFNRYIWVGSIYSNKNIKRMLWWKYQSSPWRLTDKKNLKELNWNWYTRYIPIKKLWHWDDNLYQEYINHPYKKIVNPDWISK